MSSYFHVNLDRVLLMAYTIGAVLEKFGRYPSRNEALGRDSTPKELEHLKNGPGW